MSNLIKLGVVDDHALFRKTFAQTLAAFNGFKVILEADSGTDLFDKLKKDLPDVILLDIRMPKLNGIETLKILNEKFPSIRILILSAFLDEVYVAKSIEYGVNGFLTKAMDILEIKMAVDLAFDNKVYTNNLLTNSILRSYIVKFNREAGHLLPDFTSEEIELLNYLKDEASTKEIADKMCMSQRSVEIKRDKMRKKANVKTIAGLLIHAIKRGLITIETEIK